MEFDVLLGGSILLLLAEMLGVVKSWIYYQFVSWFTTGFKMDLSKKWLKI